METPKAFREENITYFVPPFTYRERIHVDCYKLLPVVYQWKHLPTGKQGTHIVYLFQEDVKHFPRLLAHWNRTTEWEYSLTNNVLVVL